MATPAQPSHVKFMAVGRLGHPELHDFYTPDHEHDNDQLIDECLKVLAENQLRGKSSGDLHFHMLKQEDFVLFVQHGNSRLDDLFELKLLEELNLEWNPEIKLSDFMTKMAEKPKKINRPGPRGPNIPGFNKRSSNEVMQTNSTTTTFTNLSPRKGTATSSVDQIKLMMAEDQRFKNRPEKTTAVDAIKLQIMEEKEKHSAAHTPKTQDTTTTQRLSDKESEKNEKNDVEKNKGGVIILGGESTVAESKAESSAENAAVTEEMKKIKQASTNKKIFVVVILVLAVVVFALVPVLTR